MQQLQELADERAQSEQTIAAAVETEIAAADQQYQTASRQLVEKLVRRRRDLENQYAAANSSAAQQSREAIQQLEQNLTEQQFRTETAFKQMALAIERKKKESEWQALAVFDAAKDSPQQIVDAAGKRLQSRRSQVDGLQRDANTLMAMRHLTQAAELVEPTSRWPVKTDQSVSADPADPADRPEAADLSAEDLQQASLNQLHREVLRLQAQRLPSLMLEGFRFVGWWLLLCLLGAILTVWPCGWSSWMWPPAAVGSGSLLTCLAYFFLGKKAKRQSLDQYARILTLLGQSRHLELDVCAEAEAKSRQAAEETNLRKRQEIAACELARDQAAQINDARQQGELQQARALRDELLQQANAKCQQAQAAANEKYPPLLDQLADERRSAKQENLSRLEERKTVAQQVHDREWETMAGRWRSGFQAVVHELEAMQSQCEQYFPNWSVTEWDDWQRPAEPPPAIQFGRCQLPLQAIKNGISADERLVPEQTTLLLPALMTMTELPGMAISASGVGRRAAVDLLQLMMLRFLTAMPAGKLRFTIVDPSALGENFASFMHLADYDEQLVGGRIWTDARQIDERLTLLADHMEKVLQKYLRNEFETIHQYNQHAGEVSEPYHVLVVANFPVGLSDASIRKLLTIAKSGPRCGVTTLLSIDESPKLPSDVDLSELYSGAVHIEWAQEQLRWKYPLFEKLSLEIEPLPPRQQLNELLRLTGQESRVASKVEVPFSVVAPQPRDIWCGSTAKELVVPVGRAGANNLQSLRLGRGTSQHVLLSGKTGSGKSTLLHALITNLALHYSPSEVEFYLVDFKKGVEFKAYATGQLPHARVIAIESEREFGVSVLERLDEELRKRGELFRKLGVQDLEGARSACAEHLPRILLIVDEFQELFVADDKLSQDAALLMDRLVRQGRAFGIHVLLGSQTLAGAYSLARSTIGQMAVRIALECSEADAHLILSDENTAARLLNRPGEAIYNDQNGLVEGNSPFQVVWLPDQDRQKYLAEIRRQHEMSGNPVVPAIVFEGNLPADPRDNEALIATIARSDKTLVVEPTIWLGSAVRIEPPTQLTLRRQSGNHLLVLGQDETLALGILATSLVAIAAQHFSAEPRFTVLDGTRPESAEQGAWAEIVKALPGNVELVEPSAAGNLVLELADEVGRRNEVPEDAHPLHFLILHDLAQFRQLRMTEEDFSFSSLSSSGTNGKSKSLDKQFRNILVEGPLVGVHLLFWCDSYNSLTRFLDRITLREIDYRVALQMSVGDSTSIVDSPAAGRLGEHRALLYRDDLGTHVKFRPYGRPTAEWLAWVKDRLNAEYAEAQRIAKEKNC